MINFFLQVCLLLNDFQINKQLQSTTITRNHVFFVLSGPRSRDFGRSASVDVVELFVPRTLSTDFDNLINKKWNFKCSINKIRLN